MRTPAASPVLGLGTLPPSCPDIPVRVRDALTGAFAAPVRTPRAEDRTRLELAVRACTRDLRDEGWPPERVLIVLKHSALSVPASAMSGELGHAVLDDVVRWTIDEYYAG